MRSEPTVEWGGERERLSEGVPLPNVQPPTLTSQTERHKTSRSQLSSSLDSSHTLRRTFYACPQTLALTPAQPWAGAAYDRHHLSDTTLRSGNKKPTWSLTPQDWGALRLLWVTPGSVWSCWWEHALERARQPPTLSPKSSRCDRRGEAEKETQSPRPLLPSFGRTIPSLQLERVSFCQSPHAPAQEPRADRRADTLTCCCERRRRCNNSCCAFYAVWFSTWTAPRRQPARERLLPWVCRIHWFALDQMQMQPPCSLQLGPCGPSLSLGSQGSTAGLQQLEEKQLFEKFWRGTFKAVATPRPESVIVASITARKRVTEWVTYFLITVRRQTHLACLRCVFLSSFF